MATAASSARAITRKCAFEAMQPHALPYPSFTQVHIYLIDTYKAYVYIHTYTYIHVSRLCYAQLYLHTGTPAHARALMSAHTRGAHRRSRRAQRPVPHRTPAERIPPAVALRRAEKGGAYIGERGDTRGVPRADVRVERRRIVERLRAEPPAVHADSARARTCRRRMRAPPIARAHARARARTQHTGARVRRARIGDPFISVARRAWI
jgi:hypothetical protein